MASRLSCPHCKALNRQLADYQGQAVHCDQCDRPFRVRMLPPMGDALRSGTDEANNVIDEDRLELIPLEEIESPSHAISSLPIEKGLLNEHEPHSPLQAVPILLEEFDTIDSDPEPITLSPSQSLLDSLDLTPSVEPYLAPVQPDPKSPLDMLDLTLRVEPTENTPILLEEFALIQESPVDSESPEPLDENPEYLTPGEEGSPQKLEEVPLLGTQLETADEPIILLDEVQSPTERNRAAGNRSKYLSYGQQRSDKYRRPRQSDRPRRPYPVRRRLERRVASGIDIRWPIAIFGTILAVIVVAAVVVSRLNDRSTPRSTIASEPNIHQRPIVPQWNPPRFQPPPPLMPPAFPERDPRFDPPENDIKKPFAQSPMIEPKQPPAAQPKKPRAKSSLPQEKREWVSLGETAVSIEPVAVAPRIDSSPVELAARGTTYNYLLEVHSRTNGAKALLEYGPPGMKLQADARLIWQVPSDFPEPDADVTLRIQQADGKECTQSFIISIR